MSEPNPESRPPSPKEKLQLDVRRLFSDPAMAQVLNYVRAEIRAESENSEPHEKELREHCYYLLNAVVRLERMLRSFSNSGTLSSVRRERTSGGDSSAA